MTATYAYEYSGKPDGVLKLAKDKYVKLDVDCPDPKFGGLEFKLLYLNLVLRWPSNGAGVGNVRVKFIREGDDNDATAYQDYAVTDEQGSFLITHTHMEIGEANKGGRWYVKVTGDMTSAEADTRYCKWASIRKDVS